MSEKIGRNDICSCGSGKKYKNCCAHKKNTPSLKMRKLTVLNKSPATEAPKSEKIEVDYSMLMQRSFGESLKLYNDKPPIVQDPSEFKVDE